MKISEIYKISIVAVFQLTICNRNMLLYVDIQYIYNSAPTRTGPKNNYQDEPNRRQLNFFSHIDYGCVEL